MTNYYSYNPWQEKLDRVIKSIEKQAEEYRNKSSDGGNAK